MNEYVTAIAAVISGLFAIAAAFIAWRLKNASDATLRKLALDKERHEELKALFTSTFQLFENSMREVTSREEFSLSQKFSENNAKIHLLAPERIVKQYSEAAELLEAWSSLYAKASPRRMTMGDGVVTILQAPDPAAQYKEPAKEAYRNLQDKLQELVALMRTELNGPA
ncbi:hypothetical protein [Ralstonia sp. RL]|uniref:hypothetical protein n=1 Tax=Ralstonia sp. RL TaxID=1839756 RepID=UPI00257FC16B|nr:hypothetical protein [Ralstonia sp. RL]